MKAFLCSMSILLLVASVTFAQDRYGNYGGRRGWGWGGYDHASTAFEGAARGWGDLIRSAGINNLYNSEAAINWSVARRNEIENRKLGTETYFRMRAINQEARAAERGPRPSMEDLIRLSQSAAPKRLSPTEFDAVSGAINWPSALMGDDYKADRAILEKIYQDRATKGYATGDQLAEIRASTKSLQSALKANIQKYPPQSYTQAKNFLNSLSLESLKPSG